jgi:hypothetical protein
MSENPAPPPHPTLEVPADLETKYINSVRIAHSPSELLLDFAHILPGKSPARVQFQMVMSPLGAKLFYRALGENLKRFEKNFGEIQIPGEKTLADNLFRVPPEEPNKE